MSKIRVLVADDSAFIRKILSDILNSDTELEVVGSAKNGEEVLKKVKHLEPDILTLDLVMPKKNGLVVLRELMEINPLPIVVISAFSKEVSKLTINALEYGAVDFITKPHGEISLNMEDIKKEIINKVKSAFKANLKKPKSAEKIGRYDFTEKSNKVITIGSSTGDPKAREEIVPILPKNIPSPVLIVQHMPPLFTKSLANRLDNLSKIKVKEGKDGEKVKNGTAYIAPGDFHMEIKVVNNKPILTLNKKPKVLGVRPSIDKMMKSVSKIYKEKTIGIVLSGIGRDGTIGSKFIKKK